MFRVDRAIRLSLITIVFVGVMALAFWREPFLMLPIVGGAFALFFFLSWLVAPKKVPWSTRTNEPTRLVPSVLAAEDPPE
jgi:hypothetical protein